MIARGGGNVTTGVHETRSFDAILFRRLGIPSLLNINAGRPKFESGGENTLTH